LDQNQKEYKSIGKSGTKLNAFDQDLQEASYVIFDQIQDSYVQPKSTISTEHIEIPVVVKSNGVQHAWMPFAILAVILITVLFMIYMSQETSPEKMVL
jgi:hypothetical protein